MVDNKKDNGGADDFDEDFDIQEFSETDFDETAFDESELADLPEDEFSDEEFSDEEWQENQKPDKNLLTNGGKEGLSFNAKVMIGAFVIGAGVMGYTIMNSSNQQSSGGSFFQSMLDISGVMDGDFFGSKKEEKTPEELAAQQLQTQNEGFLNNPEAITPPVEENPPQPTPIAPPDEAVTDNQPLTPMPTAEAPLDATQETPRGPDEGVPENQVAIAETPIEPAQDAPTVSAEDILKQAMAGREQKPQEELPVDLPAETSQAPGIASPVIENEPPQPSSEPSNAQPAPPVPPASATIKEVAENTKALESLDGRMEDILQRMAQIESELSSVKSVKDTGTQDMDETINALKAEIAELKARPVAQENPKKQNSEKPVDEAESDTSADEVEPPKPAPRKVAKPKDVSKPTAFTGSNTRWELRAAQPGRAWVSRPGERDMQSVEVGQTLGGIGRVTEILYQNGRWTVQGTQGRISQ